MWREGSPVLYTPSLTHGNLWISTLHDCLTQGIIQKKTDPEKIGGHFSSPPIPPSLSAAFQTLTLLVLVLREHNQKV